MDLTYRSPFAIDGSSDEDEDDGSHLRDDEDSVNSGNEDASSDQRRLFHDSDEMSGSRRPSELDADDSRALLSLEKNIANMERSMSTSHNPRGNSRWERMWVQSVCECVQSFARKEVSPKCGLHARMLAHSADWIHILATMNLSTTTLFHSQHWVIAGSCFVTQGELGLALEHDPNQLLSEVVPHEDGAPKQSDFLGFFPMSFPSSSQHVISPCSHRRWALPIFGVFPLGNLFSMCKLPSRLTNLRAKHSPG